MSLPESIGEYYYQQGFNYADSTPDHSMKLGGGCQASALLISCRLLEKNPNLTMDNVSFWADRLGFAFLDKTYATRISYATIPVAAAMILTDHQIQLQHTETLEHISSLKTTKFFQLESIRAYSNMPRASNLACLFGISAEQQIQEIKSGLSLGGLAIPLVHLNTLYGSDNPTTDDLLHVVVAINYDKHSEKIRIIDPNPGFSHLPRFSQRRSAGTLKIMTNVIRSFETIKSIAKKFHPLGAVDYWVPLSVFEKSLRTCSTIITPVD